MVNELSQNEEPTSPPQKHAAKKGLLVIALIVLLVLPTIPLSLTALGPIGSGGGLLVTVVAVIGVRTFGLGKGALVALFGAVVLSLAPIGLVYPAIGTMIMVTFGGICGLAAYRGVEAPFVMMAIFTGITMVTPTPLTLEQVENGVTVTPHYILVLAGLAVVAAIWGIAVGWLLLKLPRAPRVPVQRELAMTYGATLALLGGTAAAVALTWFPNSSAGWLILTIYVIVIPRTAGNALAHDMRIKAIHRVAGTIVGVLVATAIASVIDKPLVLIVLGIICLATAMELRVVGQPYWQFVIFLTPGIVFLTGYGMNADRFGFMRLTCTIIGVLLALAALELNLRYTVPWIERSREREAASQMSSA